MVHISFSAFTYDMQMKMKFEMGSEGITHSGLAEGFFCCTKQIAVLGFQNKNMKLDSGKAESASLKPVRAFNHQPLSIQTIAV